MPSAGRRGSDVLLDIPKHPSLGKAIKAAVLSKKMPPWFADPHYGEFRNAPKLSQVDIHTLAAWADSGAHEGDPGEKPTVVQWLDGWRIEPDIVVSIPEPYYVHAKGAGEIKEFLVPSPFKEDTWVTSIEIRPSDPSVVHHVIVQVPEQPATERAAWGALQCDCGLRAATWNSVLATEPRRTDDRKSARGGSYSGPEPKTRERVTGGGTFTTMEAVYAPGSPPLDFRFHDSAKLIRGGKQIRIEVHYTPNGKETTDQTRIGFALAKAPVERRFVIMAPESLVDVRKPIPAGEANWETRGELTFTQDAELVWFMPHMHLRGRDMTFRLIYPNGREDTVLRAQFNFHWQLGYEVEEPIKVLKGTRMIVTAHHDNSAENPTNPDPTKDVRWGELTSEEMMLPWFGVLVKRDVEPQAIATYRTAGFDGPNLRALPPPELNLPLPSPPFAGKAPLPNIAQPGIVRSTREW
jgi:hypothetical protein